MLNQTMLVGRLVKKPELRETENGKSYCFITLAVQRDFKNIDGQYDTDFIECSLWDNVAKNTVKYCNKGDMVGVNGRLQTRVEENDNQKKYLMEIIADKIRFISNKKENDLIESNEQEMGIGA